MAGKPVVGVYNPSNLGLYTYAWNNPVIVKDSDGRCPECAFSALRETPGESAAVNQGLSNLAKGAWNALVSNVSDTLTGLALSRPVWAPPPTSEAIDSAREVSGAGALERNASFDNVPVEAEVAGGALVGLAFAGAGSKAAARGAATAEKGFFAGTRYTEKVAQQMKAGVGEFHSFPESVKAFESAGTVRTITGGDGVAREMLEIPGSYGSRNGVFEFIKEPGGAINHRYFRPDP